MNRRGSFALLVFCAAALAACSDDAPLAADAGADFTLSVGQAPEFNGCDSNGDIDSYAWQIVEAPAGMADDAGKLLRQPGDDCSFVLESSMVVADVGSWVIELTVSTGEGDTATDRVTVTVG